ncbi:MAG: acyl carrier protein [Planctomycetota bacterium]
MSESEVFEFLRAQVQALTGLDPARIQPGSRLIDLGLDSAKAIDVVASAEDRFDLDVPDRVLVESEDLGQLARWIEERRGG